MRIFLTLKHWQIFIIMVAIPLFFQVLEIGLFFFASGQVELYYYYQLLMTLFWAPMFAWFYSLGAALHKRLPATVTMNLVRFKLLLFVPCIYLLLSAVFINSVASFGLSAIQPSVPILITDQLLRFVSIACMLYCIYFVAKALKAVEWQKPVVLNDFTGEFFLVWFFPVGIWFIQPRINSLFDNPASPSITTN